MIFLIQPAKRCLSFFVTHWMGKTHHPGGSFICWSRGTSHTTSDICLFVWSNDSSFTYLSKPRNFRRNLLLLDRLTGITLLCAIIYSHIIIQYTHKVPNACGRFITAPILSSFDQIWIFIEYFLRFPKGYTPDN